MAQQGGDDNNEHRMAKMLASVSLFAVIAILIVGTVSFVVGYGFYEYPDHPLTEVAVVSMANALAVIVGAVVVMLNKGGNGQ